MTDNSDQQSNNSKSKIVDVLIYGLFAAYVLIAVGSIYVGILGLLCFPVSLLFAFFLASRRYNWSGAIFFIIICLAISITYENLSIATGFPFGFYHWSVKYNPGPWIGTVPLLTGIAYCGTGYISWVMAEILIGRTESMADKTRNRFITPFIAAFIMVMWDLGMDPMSSTVSHVWEWTYGGGFFGVPLSNFLGWFLVVWTIYQVFSLFIAYRKMPLVPMRTRKYDYLATIFYVCIGLNDLLPYDLNSKKMVTDNSGKVWAVADIYESIVIVTLFSMVFVGFLALVRLRNSSYLKISS